LVRYYLTVVVILALPFTWQQNTTYTTCTVIQLPTAG